MRVAIIALLALTGCGRVAFDRLPDDGAVEDLGAEDALPFGGFTDAVALPSISGADPQIRHDGLELWVADVPPDYDLYVTRRTDVTVAFPPASVDAVFSAGTPDTEPALSGDGLVFMFVSDRTGSFRLYEARRPDLASAFAPPSVAVGLENIEVASFDLLPSGDAVYFESPYGSTSLYRASRASSNQPFGVPVPVAGVSLSFPTVSPDELLMFGNRPTGDGLDWATRTSVNDAWIQHGRADLPGCSSIGSSDADISPDGARLVVRCPELVLLSR
jgi:hypothetical protein